MVLGERYTSTVSYVCFACHYWVGIASGNLLKLRGFFSSSLQSLDSCDYI